MFYGIQQASSYKCVMKCEYLKNLSSPHLVKTSVFCWKLVFVMCVVGFLSHLSIPQILFLSSTLDLGGNREKTAVHPSLKYSYKLVAHAYKINNYFNVNNFIDYVSIQWNKRLLKASKILEQINKHGQRK